MNVRINPPRLLGATFLVVVLTSLVSGVLLSSAVGSGTASNLLTHLADNVVLMRLSILAGLANSVGVVVLAALLYVVLEGQSRLVAVVALGLWLAEAIFYAVSQIGSVGLISLSADFVKPGAPDPSYFQGLTTFMFDGVAKLAITVHMFFYCSGGLLWYALLYKSRFIPSVIPAFGLAVVSIGLLGVAWQLLGNTVPIFVFLAILPFELLVGTWLLVKGARSTAEASAPHPVAWSPRAAAGGTR
jgi:Domain of unknown function (DUF4386)